MRITALALLVGLSSAAWAAELDPYVFDVLALQPYKGNFARLVKGKGIPDWVKAIAVQGAGTAGPSRTVDVAGTPYRLDRVCKVGASCATARIDVLWAPRGARVWAALVDGDKAPVLLGQPKEAQAKALQAAADPAVGPASTAAAPSPAPGVTPFAQAAVAPAPAVTPASPVSTSSVATAAPQAPPSQPEAEPDPYIFDVLPLQPYKGNFARLVQAPGLPAWVRAISAQGAGAAGPAKTVEVAGAPYRLDRVCKVGAACASDRLDVLWAPRGARVWGALVEGGKPPVMLGDPKGAQEAALTAGGSAAPTALVPGQATSAPK